MTQHRRIRHPRIAVWLASRRRAIAWLTGPRGTADMPNDPPRTDRNARRSRAEAEADLREED